MPQKKDAPGIFSRERYKKKLAEQQAQLMSERKTMPEVLNQILGDQKNLLDFTLELTGLPWLNRQFASPVIVNGVMEEKQPMLPEEILGDLALGPGKAVAPLMNKSKAIDLFQEYLKRSVVPRFEQAPKHFGQNPVKRQIAKELDNLFKAAKELPPEEIQKFFTIQQAIDNYTSGNFIEKYRRILADPEQYKNYSPSGLEWHMPLEDTSFQEALVLNELINKANPTNFPLYRTSSLKEVPQKEIGAEFESPLMSFASNPRAFTYNPIGSKISEGLLILDPGAKAVPLSGFQPNYFFEKEYLTGGKFKINKIDEYSGTKTFEELQKLGGDTRFLLKPDPNYPVKIIRASRIGDSPSASYQGSKLPEPYELAFAAYKAEPTANTKLFDLNTFKTIFSIIETSNDPKAVKSATEVAKRLGVDNWIPKKK